MPESVRLATNTWLLPTCSSSSLRFVVAGLTLVYLFVGGVFLWFVLSGYWPSLAAAVLFLFLAVALWRMAQWARLLTIFFLWAFLFVVAIEGLKGLLSAFWVFALEAVVLFVAGYICLTVLNKCKDEFQRRLI